VSISAAEGKGIMAGENLQGKRFLALVRCSTMAQAGSSPEDQERLVLSFAGARGMVHSGTLRLDGQSGLDWRDIDGIIAQVIERKQTLNDFEVVVIQDSSRLTRCGGEHGHYLRFMLRKHGVRVLNAANHIDDPAIETLVRTVEFEVANGQVRAQALAIARGLRSSVERGRRTYCTVPPYGIDRLILSADGTPLYRIRNKSDGTQVKVRPDSEEEYEMLPPTRKGAPPSKHRKAKHELAVLVPGEPAQREVVGRIYRRRFADDVGAPSIARELNEMGVPSPRASRSERGWTPGTVQQILDNPIYTGQVVAFRRSSARLFRVGGDCPEQVPAQQSESDMRKRPIVWRPEEVWVWREEERLRDYLPADLRERAAAHHRQVLRRDAGGRVPTPRHDPNRESRYLLKGLLRTTEGLPLTGTGSGKGARYYRVHPRDARRAGLPHPATRLPADRIERKVLDLLRETLFSDPLLAERVAEALRLVQEQSDASELSAAALEQERRTIRDDILFLVGQRATAGDTVVAEALAELRPRLEAIESQLEAIARIPRLTEAEIKDRVAAIVADLRSRASMWENASPGQMRNLLEAVVSDIRVDLETCNVTVTLRPPDEVARAMGPVAPPLYRQRNWTHGVARSLTFQFSWPDGPCPNCHRRRAA
jgi:hypothetical protein